MIPLDKFITCECSYQKKFYLIISTLQSKCIIKCVFKNYACFSTTVCEINLLLISMKDYKSSPSIPAVTSQEILARLDESKLKVKGYFVYIANTYVP